MSLLVSWTCGMQKSIPLKTKNNKNRRLKLRSIHEVSYTPVHTKLACQSMNFWFKMNDNGPDEMMLEKGSSFPSLFSQHVINFLFQPLFVVWDVSSSAFLQHKAAEIWELIHKIKELWDVIGDALIWRMNPLQVFLKYFANSFKALVERLIVRVCASVRPGVWLNQ